jgi:hypothetical protein
MLGNQEAIMEVSIGMMLIPDFIKIHQIVRSYLERQTHMNLMILLACLSLKCYENRLKGATNKYTLLKKCEYFNIRRPGKNYSLP